MTSTTLPAGSPRSRVFGEPQLHTDGDLLVLHFGPDGSLWSVEEPGVVRKWNVKGQLLETHNLSDFETLWAFSRDARVLASGSDDLTLWDGSSGHVLTALPQESWVTALAINTDPMYLATGHDDGSIRYWDLAGHAALHTFRQHDLPISALAFDREGKFLAAASEDRTISLWDVASGKSLGTLTGHTDRIPGLAWHPTQRLLVSVGWDQMARLGCQHWRTGHAAQRSRRPGERSRVQRRRHAPRLRRQQLEGARLGFCLEEGDPQALWAGK